MGTTPPNTNERIQQLIKEGHTQAQAFNQAIREAIAYLQKTNPTFRPNK